VIAVDHERRRQAAKRGGGQVAGSIGGCLMARHAYAEAEPLLVQDTTRSR
jgi:hypothetical protein